MEVYGVLKLLGSQETPMRLTISRNLTLLTPTEAAFTTAKEAKFNEVVTLDDKGTPVITEAAKTAIAEQKLNPAYGLPYGAYEYDTEDGQKVLTDFIEALKDEEAEVVFVPMSLKKLIRITNKNGTVESIALEDLLESPDSKIDSYSLGVLSEAGVLK